MGGNRLGLHGVLVAVFGLGAGIASAMILAAAQSTPLFG
jgi:hypothetical protein